jgi:hypothetical protein
MRALSASELLGTRGQGTDLSTSRRALLLLSQAYTDFTLEQIAQFSIGQRDELLLTLREQTFGSRLASITTCPACAEQLEFHIDAADVRATPEVELKVPLNLTHGDYTVEFRLPTSLDLVCLDPAADLEMNRQELLERCVIATRRAGAEISATELPAEVGMAIAQRMADADPQADVQLALTCPKCQHSWRAPLDIVSYFLSEIDAWADRLLREVHSLASAYGWREAEVLALSPWRRQAYLELIEA